MGCMKRRLLVGVVLLMALTGSACGPAGEGPDVQAGAGAGNSPAGGARTPGSEGGAPRAPQDSTVRVHYPAGSRALALTGEHAPLDKPATLEDVKNNTWELVLKDLVAPVPFKPTLDGKIAKGPPYVVQPGQTVDIYPHFDADHGALVGWDYQFPSAILDNTHPIRLYLPPSYEENTEKKYPVIYMHDGQIIFERDLGLIDTLAKDGYGSFRTETVLDAEIASGKVPEAIVVGIDIRITVNLNPLEFSRDLTSARVKELTPTPDDALVGFEGTGQGPKYLRMIAEELKPAIDKKFRTLPDREHTFMMGASLGGLISVWGGLHNGDVFGAIASLSTAIYWDKEVVVRSAKSTKIGPKSAARIYVDVGADERGEDTSELAQLMPSVEQQQRLVAGLTAAGYVEGKTLEVVVDPAGKHDGGSWSKRLPNVLPFLLGPGR
jgi:predicted alpha/beta superfamily hydrolase